MCRRGVGLGKGIEQAPNALFGYTHAENSIERRADLVVYTRHKAGSRLR